jgi:hypothetical protein
MKKTVWTFGLIAGAIMSAMMVATVPFMDRFGFDKGEVIGYTTMVAAFLLVFFGIRSYRDKVAGGTIGFGRALAIGALITAVASACYTVTWEVLYYEVMPDFGAKFGQYQLDRARAQGKSDAELAKMRAEAEKFTESYKNPVFNSAVTFLEPLPVGLVITLVSAGVLRRKRRRDDPALAPA